jgi:hypothetical protein
VIGLSMLTGGRAALIAAVIAGVAGAAAGWTAQGWRVAGRIEALRAEHAQAVAASQAAHAAQLRAAAEQSARLAKEAQDVLDQLQADRAAVAADRARLYGQLDRLRDVFRAAPSAAGRCSDDPAARAAAESADVVRADVFERAVSRAVELAGAVDEQHAYARACAARYRQVTEALQGRPSP